MPTKCLDAIVTSGRADLVDELTFSVPAAAGFKALLENTLEWEAICADSGLIPNAVEEIQPEWSSGGLPPDARRAPETVFAYAPTLFTLSPTSKQGVTLADTGVTRRFNHVRRETSWDTCAMSCQRTREEATLCPAGESGHTWGR